MDFHYFDMQKILNFKSRDLSNESLICLSKISKVENLYFKVGDFWKKKKKKIAKLSTKTPELDYGSPILDVGIFNKESHALCQNF